MAKEPAIRVTLLPRDTNEKGTIFGGIILEHLDLAGGIEASKNAPQKSFVTVAMKEVVFKQAVYVGDIVSFYTQTIKIGTTSITVHVDVYAQRRHDPEQIVKVTEAEVVYVAIDKQGRPIPVKD